MRLSCRRCAISGAKPGPSSRTSIETLSASKRAETRISDLAKSTAFSTNADDGRSLMTADDDDASVGSDRRQRGAAAVEDDQIGSEPGSDLRPLPHVRH